MDNNPIRDPRFGDPRLIEALEACRSGDDLADPNLAFLSTHLAEDAELDQLHERLQYLDRRLTDAFQEVSVPEGLETRILDRLALARSPAVSETRTHPEVVVNPISEPACTACSKKARVSRRWLVLGAGGLGLGLAISLLMALIATNRPVIHSDSEVLESALRQFEADADTPEKWNSMADSPLLRQFPFSSLVLRPADGRWRPVEDFLGCSGVAYDLTPQPRGPHATLYVLSCQGTVPTAPPSRPALTTGNRSVAAWQSGNLLYVLVVSGGPQTYRSFLNVPRGPLA
jgi:hypothetical protein